MFWPDTLSCIFWIFSIFVITSPCSLLDILFLKHDSSLFRQSSNTVSGFSMMEQVRLCAVWPTENWLGSSMNHIQGWKTVWICHRQALEKGCLLSIVLGDSAWSVHISRNLRPRPLPNRRKCDLMREEDVVSYASGGVVPLNVAEAKLELARAVTKVVTLISPISQLCSSVKIYPNGKTTAAVEQWLFSAVYRLLAICGRRAKSRLSHSQASCLSPSRASNAAIKTSTWLRRPNSGELFAVLSNLFAKSATGAFQTP